MIKFHNTTTGAVLEYEGGENWDSNTQWVWNELDTKGSVSISRVFHFTKEDLLDLPDLSKDFTNHSYQFQLGTFDGDYIKIPRRILDINNDLLISRDVTLKRSIFVAERNISIFGQLSELLDNSNPIVIGGTRSNAIPIDVFEELRKKFPNTYELNRYAGARIQTILSQHFDGMKDARGRYEIYLNKKTSLTKASKLDLTELNKFEIEKYTLIRDLIKNALETKTNWAEAEWQQRMLSFLLLLFPKYIKVLTNVTIHDYYSNTTKKTDRYIDIALVDANGNLDIIEVKKPFDDKILRKSLYRGNSIPTPELSGSIMQAEKYLFHLSKWGVNGEKQLTENMLPIYRKA